MGHAYTPLTLEDRCQMAHLHATGHSLRHIAAPLDRAPSTVARELKRNASATPAMPTNKPARGAGRAPSSTAIAPCVRRSWPVCNTAGRPNKWPGACAGPCPVRPTWRPSRTSALRDCCKPIIIRRANASAIRPRPRFFGTICCTSNVNPPPRFRRNDSKGKTGMTE